MPDPTFWQHFILSCAVEVGGKRCGEFIENEPCPVHGTEAPDDLSEVLDD